MANEIPPLGEIIRQRRQALGLSSISLAGLSGLHRSVVYRIESGEIAQPVPDTLSRLARALQLNAAELLAVAGHPVPQLPLRPYLRTAYDLPDAAISEVEGYLKAVRMRYGAGPASRPRDGEDEVPEQQAK
jgi:transcriptional regulator with XRE-family HTH domain